MEYINHILSLVFDFTKNLYFLPYWLPFGICFAGWTFQSVREYNVDFSDRDLREKEGRPSYYRPSITVGKIIGRFVVCALPVVNLGPAIFKFFPSIVKDIIKAFDNWLDIPLVPNKPVKIEPIPVA